MKQRKMQYTNRETERLIKWGRETTAQDSNRRRWCRCLGADNRKITDKCRDRQTERLRPCPHREYTQQSQVRLMQGHYSTPPFLRTEEQAGRSCCRFCPSYLSILLGREPGRCTQRRSNEERDGMGGNEIQRTNRNHQKQKPLWES